MFLQAGSEGDGGKSVLWPSPFTAEGQLSTGILRLKRVT